MSTPSIPFTPAADVTAHAATIDVGRIAHELRHHEVTDVLVSIGGGGLISGVAVAARAARPDVRIWGVETVGADAMTRALAAGEPVATPLSSIVTTLSAPAVSALTLEHVRALVEDVLVVTDDDAVAGTVALAEPRAIRYSSRLASPCSITACPFA